MVSFGYFMVGTAAVILSFFDMKKKHWLQHKECLIDILVRLICKLDGVDQHFKVSDRRIHGAYDALMLSKDIQELK